MKVSALLDTGSQVTCISEEFFKQLNMKTNLETLPVSKVMVIPAIGKKSVTVRQQVFLELNLGNQKILYSCLVIPHLCNQLILGNDWLLKNHVIVDYKNRTLEVNGIRICRPIVSFDLDPLNKLVSSTREGITTIQIIKTYIEQLEVEEEIDEIENQDENIQMMNLIDHRAPQVNCEEISDDLTNDTNKIINENAEKEIEVNREIICFSENNEIVEHDEIVEDEELDLYMLNIENSVQISQIRLDKNQDANNGSKLEKVVINAKTNNTTETANFYQSPDEKYESCGEDHNFFKEISNIASNLTSLSGVQMETFVKLLERHKKLFSSKPGCTNVYEHKIKLTKSNPIIRKSYPLPFAIRGKVSGELEVMLQLGIIERSISPHCNPLRIVKKGEGKIRICLDARYLNDVIESDQESPPPIMELLQKHHGTKYMTTIDLTHGYWQIPLATESRPYTAFLHGSHLYHFCRVPFGLKTAGSGFIRALNLALGNEYSEFLTCYIDDLLITSRSFEEHMHHLDLIFTKLAQHNFTLKLEKSKFCQESLNFLGFILSTDGIRPDPKKLEIIRNFAEPENKTQLQQILGICNFYRQFSLKHAYYIDPFRELLKKDVCWKWTRELSKAYQDLKDNFANDIVLHHILPNTPFNVQTDASDKGICGILYQTDDKGHHYLISLVSRCLTSPEIHYTTTEKELLAVIYSVQKFRMYLIGSKFRIITDHKSLTFLKNTTFHNARLIRWTLLLQEYHFDISHCKGKDNIVADFFSRNPESKFAAEQEPEKLIISRLEAYSELLNVDNVSKTCNTIYKMTLDKELTREFKDIKNLQKKDTWIEEKLKSLSDRDNDNTHFQLHNDILFQYNPKENQWRIVVPTCLINKLIKYIHDRLGHPGQYKTLQYLRVNYYWKGMSKDVKKSVRSCDLCQRIKVLTAKMEGEWEMVKAERPGDLATVDYYGPLPKSVGGVQYIFVVMDAFSKYVNVYPVKKATTRISLKKILESYIPKMGKPKRILADNGTQFTAQRWKQTLEGIGIKICYSSVRHPQSNPTERIMKELGRLFRAMCSQQHTKWAKCIPTIQELLNVTTHFSTGYTPVELHFNQKPIEKIKEIVQFPPSTEIDHETKIVVAKERLLKNFRMRKKQQKTKTTIELNENDLVLLKVPLPSNALDRVTHKFFHIYQGPYKITKVLGKNAFVLSNPENSQDVKGIHNRVNLRKYYTS